MAMGSILNASPMFSACGIIVVQCVLDGQQLEQRVYPAPSVDGFFKGQTYIYIYYKVSLPSPFRRWIFKGQTHPFVRLVYPAPFVNEFFKGQTSTFTKVSLPSAFCRWIFQRSDSKYIN